MDHESLAQVLADIKDAGERQLVAASEISDLAGRMMAQGNSSHAAVTLSGGGIVAAVVGFTGVVACLIGVCAVVIASYKIDALQREVSQLRDKVEVHEVYINAEFRRNQEK